MKLALTLTAPDIEATVPVALLAGSFPVRLARAAALGFDGVELLTVDPARVDVAALRAELARHGLQVAALGTGAIALLERLTLLATSVEIEHRAFARLRRVIDLAAALGAPVVTIGSFRGRLAWSDADGLDHLAEILHDAGEAAAARNVRLAVEPLNRYETDVVQTVDEGLHLIERVGHSHVGLLFDTFHANIEEPQPFAALEQAMARGRLWHVHLADSNRLAPGWGHFDFAGCVRTLAAAGYRGWLSAELLRRPDPDAAAVQTAQVMRALVPADL